LVIENVFDDWEKIVCDDCVDKFGGGFHVGRVVDGFFVEVLAEDVGDEFEAVEAGVCVLAHDFDEEVWEEDLEDAFVMGNEELVVAREGFEDHENGGSDLILD
jgi:hypothetical protein